MISRRSLLLTAPALAAARAWGQSGAPAIRLRSINHVTIRVSDFQRSLDFYTQVLGMRLLRKTDYPGGRFTNAFVGYEDESRAAVLELTHNWDTKSYDLGTGYGHVAIEIGRAHV